MAQNNTQNRYRSTKRNSRRRARRRVVLQNPNGTVAPRVKKVGPERFAIVCIDPAKHRSEWMMADYLGNLIIENTTMEHRPQAIQQAIQLVRRAGKQHRIRDLIVVIERTGNYHQPIKRAFAQAGFDTRIIHPYATKQFRLPANPGNKTDANDLAAMHRAASAGFGLIELPLEPLYRHLRALTRHRRSLVQKASALCCQIREHLHLAMPGYAALFRNIWNENTPLAIARLAGSPQALLQLGPELLALRLRKLGIAFQKRTIEKVMHWAKDAAPGPLHPDADIHHCIWTDLEELRCQLRQRIYALEAKIVALLVRTPYVRLMAISGINVVSAAEYAGEMGPINHYANAARITGRAGLYPARYQSDLLDLDSGPIVRSRNRRLRAAIMRIADNLAKCNHHFNKLADAERRRGIDPRATRVKIAQKFARLSFAALAGDEPLNHPCCAKPHYVLAKLRSFHQEHNISIDQLIENLQAAAQQLPQQTQHAETIELARQLNLEPKPRHGPSPMADILPAVLARFRQLHTTGEAAAN